MRVLPPHYLPGRPAAAARRGAAVVELAVLLPFLAFVFFVTIDYSRIFYYTVTVTNAAVGGALYGSQDATHAADAAGIQAAALADATNLRPTPTVTATAGRDADGNPTINVTVTYTFRTITNYPGLPGQVTVSRTASMRVAP